ASIRATTSGCASWQSRLRRQSRAFDALLAHPAEGTATATRRIAWQGRAAYSLSVQAVGSLCVLHAGEGGEPAAGASTCGRGIAWWGRDEVWKEHRDGQVCPYGRRLSDCRQYPGGIDVCAQGLGSGGL